MRALAGKLGVQGLPEETNRFVRLSESPSRELLEMRTFEDTRPKVSLAEILENAGVAGEKISALEAKDVYNVLDAAGRVGLFSALDDDGRAKLLNALDTAHRAELLRVLNNHGRRWLFNALNNHDRAELKAVVNKDSRLALELVLTGQGGE